MVDQLTRLFSHEAADGVSQSQQRTAHGLGIFLHILVYGVHLLHGVAEQVAHDDAQHAANARFGTLNGLSYQRIRTAAQLEAFAQACKVYARRIAGFCTIAVSQLRLQVLKYAKNIALKSLLKINRQGKG